MVRIALLLFAVAAAAAEPPYTPRQPLPEPRLFAPGVISTADFDSHPAFTPDGRTLYFLKSSPNFTFWTMLVSRWKNGTWSEPELAPWAGQFRDADPFVTRDGQRLFFISDRPVDGKPKEDMDIWMMERRGDGWGEPIHLPEPVNSSADEWFPNVASDGTIYFGSSRPGGLGRSDIYRCRVAAGVYGPAENLGEAINAKGDEFEALIAPDQSWIVFMASGRPEGKGSGDFYVSVVRDGKWTPARNVGEPINSYALEISPTLSPDGRWFFFTSTRGTLPNGKPLPKRITTSELKSILRGPQNGLGNIWQVDVRALGVGDGAP